MSLPRFSVRQVVLVNLVFLLLMVAGIHVSRRIPVDLFPDISFNNALITTVWAGASPQEVERLVTKKLEEEIDGISGIKEILSYSSHSLSEINVEWDESLADLEYEAALNDLRAAIDRTFAHRDTHAVPASVPAPSAHWTPVYARMLSNDGLLWRTLAEVTEAVQAFLDPVLVGEPGTWRVDEWAWTQAMGDV